jgi:hypothetical protein
LSISLYNASIPACVAVLTNLKNMLGKAAAEKPEADLIEARLSPDMYALARQVQFVSDTAKGIAARLSGAESPSMPDTEATFAELQERCDKTIAFVQSVDAASIDAGAEREIEIKFPNGGGMRFDGATYLTGFALPNLYFHAGMAYAILRKEGVSVGKMDFLTHLGPYVFAPPEAQPASADA